MASKSLYPFSAYHIYTFPYPADTYISIKWWSMAAFKFSYSVISDIPYVYFWQSAHLAEIFSYQHSVHLWNYIYVIYIWSQVWIKNWVEYPSYHTRYVSLDMQTSFQLLVMASSHRRISGYFLCQLPCGRNMPYMLCLNAYWFHSSICQ